MSDDKKNFFDYDNYVQSSLSKIKNASKNNKSGKTNTPKQKPAKLVPAAEQDKSAEKPKSKKKPVERDFGVDSIKKMFGEALDESKEELAEFAEDQTVPDAPIANPEGLRRKLYMIFGIVITLLAIVGFFSTINFAVDKVKAFADNTQQKNEFAKFIYPIVICDPAPFDQTVKLRSDTMITAAIWDIILYEDKSKYEADFDMMIVPEVDIEQHGTKLFGNNLHFEHQSILGSGVQFYYDESIKSYRVPSNPKYFTYSPFIEDVSRVGERYTLTVGYVSPTPAWLTLTSDDAPEPEKYVEYVVTKRGNEMMLVAIHESEMQVESPHGL
ncbi:MAG: hypothetical protein K2K44_03205 [Oscillospiraceae bacterium]|nr:hypothetical protein [Oscillospiraceae bacterium]